MKKKQYVQLPGRRAGGRDMAMSIVGAHERFVYVRTVVHNYPVSDALYDAKALVRQQLSVEFVAK